MIDLSFLTEEEQEAIFAVLRRDAELKKTEELRVQNLQETVRDRSQLRYMTGEWFYETKQLRHQDRIHGSDIIRASMRHTHKPLTILEISQILPEKPSFVCSQNEEVFVPPVLCGVLQEPPIQVTDDRPQNQDPFDMPQETPKPVLQSPTKQRKNPFDSEVNAGHTFKDEASQLLDGAEDQSQMPREEHLSPSDGGISHANDLKQDPSVSPVTQGAPFPQPVDGNRAVSITSVECLVEGDGPGGRQANAAAPRGILKRLSTSSSTDSLASRLDPQSPVSAAPPAEICVDRKQVRFSSTVGPGVEEWQDGRELGEHGLLDVDVIPPTEVENENENEDGNESRVDSEEGGLSCNNDAKLQEREAGQPQVLGDVSEHCHPEFRGPEVPGFVSAEQESGKPVHLETESEEDRHSQAEATERPTEDNCQEQKLPEQSTDPSSVEISSNTKQSTNGSPKSSPHGVSPKPRQRLLGFLRRDKDKPATVQSPQKEDVKTPEEKEQDNTQNLFQGAADMTEDKPASVKKGAKPCEMKEYRTLQLTALQNTPFKETVTSVDADTLQEATEGRAGQLPEGRSDLKEFWERENSGPKIIFTREVARHKDTAKTGLEASHGAHTNSDVETININVPPQMEMTVEDTEEKSSSLQNNRSLLVDLSEEDGTYRANPVLICEETDDSLTISVTEPQISEQQENIISVPSYVAFNTQKEEQRPPVPLPRQASSSPQEDRPANTSELRHVGEKECTGPRGIAAKVSEATSSLIHRSSGNTEEQSTHHQFQVKADTKARTPSPIKAHPPRSKDPDEEVRRSPSKTCHPRALESSSPRRSRLEGSPLKTFPIDIDPQSKVAEMHQGKSTPVPRPRKSPSAEPMQTVPTESKSCTDTGSHPLPLHMEDRVACVGNVNTQESSSSSSTSPQSQKASEKKLGTSTSLARSFIPQDYQHYLGPQEKAHLPPFHQEKAAAADCDVEHRPLNAPGQLVGNQSDSPTEGNPPTVTSWTVQNEDGNSSQDTAARSWSLPRASSGSYGETSSPVVAALKRLSSRSVSSSKSLENLTSHTRKKTQKNSSEQMNQSVDDVSSHPPSAFPLSTTTQMKTSVSVPLLQQDETDSDSTFETNLGWRRNTGSSMSNLSLSSGMASMSSVSGSLSSICPADTEVQGSIQLAVNYIQKLGEFHVFVVNCRDLADTKKNRCDPYVKCYLLPDKTKLGKRKTSVKKKTLNPTYNEILKFKILKEVLKTQNLNISVWHNDTFGRNGFLGEVELDLSEWDFSNTQINEYALKARVSAQTSTPSPSCLTDNRGEMRVALRFLPQTSHSKRTSRTETGEVQIWVKDCKNLPPVRGVTIDPFVKCTVLPDTSRKSRQKTRVVKRTANPMFNHTMVYDGFRPDDLREACVEITVWDHDRLNSHYIGGLRLGLGTGRSYGVEVIWMDSSKAEAHLWQKMLQSDGEWVEAVLPLRMLLMAKSMSK